jgi:hypothetical protein
MCRMAAVTIGLLLGLTGTVSFSAWAICDGVPLHVNHDGTFESGYIWVCGEDEDGAFAEGFQGPGRVCAVQFYYCKTGLWVDTREVRVFIWDNEDGHPGAVLAMRSAEVGQLERCPDLGPPQEVELSADVGAEFFVGVSQCAIDYSLALGADQDGPASGEQSWFKNPEGYPVPAGWYRINDLFSGPPLHALAVGVYLEPMPVPTAAETWGAIKGLFRK